jgi:hypothetical protein
MLPKRAGGLDLGKHTSVGFSRLSRADKPKTLVGECELVGSKQSQTVRLRGFVQVLPLD